MDAVLVCAPTGGRKNIGDYIQSVAQEQFYKHVDQYVDREKLDSYSWDVQEKIKLVMNGWFMWYPESFPPAPCFNPLFISFHIVPDIADRFFTKSTIDYLKRYEPIGARDLGTCSLLESKGIRSYFSSCLTTTLNLKYLNTSPNKTEILFVDPYYSIAGTRSSVFHFKQYFSDLYLVFKNRKKVNRFINKFENEYWTWYGRLSRRFEKRICASVFYEYYSKIFSDDVLFEADYVTHNIPSSKYATDEEWMDAAKILIKRYASAKYVITSRIHCALPCLGVETPVIFVNSSELTSGQIRSAGRFGGLLDLLNVIRIDNNFIPVSQSMKDLLSKGKININTKFSNPVEYKAYRDELINRVSEFLKKEDIH